MNDINIVFSSLSSAIIKANDNTMITLIIQIVNNLTKDVAMMLWRIIGIMGDNNRIAMHGNITFLRYSLNENGNTFLATNVTTIWLIIITDRLT